MPVVPLEHLPRALLAGAAGDCIGAPFEGLATAPQFDPSAHDWRVSDDTILSLATLRSIRATGEPLPDSIADEFATVFRAGRIPGVGASTLKALRDLASGTHWALAGRKGERAAGNGAAMRVAPLAFYLDADEPADRRALRDICRITHHNDEAYVGALAIVKTMQITGFSSVANGLRAVLECLPDTRVRDVLAGLTSSEALSPAEAASVTGTGGFAAESVPLAIYVALSSADLGAGLVTAVRQGGDTDTVASMVGHVMGAWGHELPASWRALLPAEVLAEVRR